MATPPGGWKFIVPESMSVRLKGTKVSAGSLEQLRKAVARLFMNNGEPFQVALFESELCASLPPQYCTTCGDKGIEWREYEPMSAKKILAFFGTLVSTGTQVCRRGRSPPPLCYLRLLSLCYLYASLGFREAGVRHMWSRRSWPQIPQGKNFRACGPD